MLLEKHANVIVSKMEQDETLMEDSPDAEELRRSVRMIIVNTHFSSLKNNLQNSSEGHASMPDN